MIRANCRERFTHDDFTFVVNSLARNASAEVALTDLLTDSDSRDRILDDESLFDELTKGHSFSKISPYLYFYLLTRRVFLDNDIDDRNITDYVACMLAQFSSTQRAHSISHNHPQNYRYLVDMMTDFLGASSFEAFLIRSHVGNYALFITGLFPDHVYQKATYGRKAPGFDYYEKMGSSSYRWASRHELALKYSLVEILATLAENFRTVRIALNQLKDNYINLDDRPATMDRMLRQIFFGKNDDNQFDA